MGVRPNVPEEIPHIFDIIATSGVSLVVHMCLFCLSPCAELPSPPHARGSPRGQTGPSRLLELAMGPYCMGELLNSGYQIT